ncbi:MAG: VTT domain-containing protein [Myxococcota bacterium]
MATHGAPPRVLAPPLDRSVLIRFVLGVVLLIGAVGALGWFFRAQMASAAEWFVGEFGLYGVFFGMLLVDAYAFPPLAHEPILFFAHAGGLDFLQVALVAGAGSFLAGPIGYLVGRLLRRVPWVQSQLRRSGITPLMRRRGVWVVAVAAVSPLPFSAATYAAGALRVPFGPFMLACALRFPKVLAYLAMIAFGWSLG